MSTTYHDPIATGAPANASVFNAPLGQLDQALAALSSDLSDLISRALQEAQVQGSAQTGATKINFAGAGVTGTYDAPTKTLTLTIPGAAGTIEAHVIQVDGLDQPTRSRLNFLTAGGLEITDHAEDDSSDIGVDLTTAHNYETLNQLAEAPATPTAGKMALYAKTDGKLYTKDDAGTETEMGAGGAAPGGVSLGLMIALGG